MIYNQFIIYTCIQIYIQISITYIYYININNIYCYYYIVINSLKYLIVGNKCFSSSSDHKNL